MITMFLCRRALLTGLTTAALPGIRLLCGLLLLSLGPACSMASDRAAAGGDSPIVMTPTAFRVGEHLVEGDRGWLAVRENRARDDSRTIKIAFVRFRHPDGGTAPPIVYLPGGPGQAAVGSARSFAATYRNYLNIGGQGDMLVVEQRGIGASEPRLDCPGLLTRPSDQPLSAAVMGSTHERYIETCRKTWEDQGVDLAGYDVISMADDIEELRAGLGYDRIRLAGESFGAHHALAYIQRHGERVERAVLSAVIGPDDMFEMPAAVERQLAGLNGGAATGRGLPDKMAAVLRGLNEPVGVRVPTDRGEMALDIGRYDLALATVTLARQTDFLRQLPALYDMIAGGDLSWLAGWSAKIRFGHPSNLASLAITCASGASAERRAAITQQAEASLLGDAVDLLGADLCTPLADLEPSERLQMPVRADMPILLISGELDSRAPSSNAEALLPGLSKGRHVVFPGVSHDFGETRDAQIELEYRFLAHGETEPNPALLPAAR